MARKWKILALSPYEGMRGLIETVAQDRDDIDVVCRVSDLCHITDPDMIAKEAKKMQISDYDAILSRGGTAQKIASVASVPVVEVSVSAFDLLRIIQLTKDYVGKPAVVGFKSLTASANMLCQLLQYETGIFTIESQKDLPELLEHLKHEGYGLVIGDTVTVPMANQAGLEAVLLTSGKESVLAALDETVAMVSALAAERRRRVFAEAVLNSAETQVAVFTPGGELVYSTHTEDELAQLHRIMMRNLELTSQRHKVRLVKKTVDGVQIINGVQNIIDGKPYVVYFSAAKHNWKLEEGNGVQIRNKAAPLPEGFSVYSDSSAVMRQVVTTAQEYSKTLLPVLLIGEVGVGKETMASAIHASGAYRDNPFVTIDCNLMTPRRWNSLFEGERSILLEENLTIHFMSIHTLNNDLAQSLMSFISNTSVHRRNRLIFSYSSEAEENVDNNKLCRFLKNQLGALTLVLPPLRSRRAGIPGLASLRLSELAASGTKQIAGFAPGALEPLQGFSWIHNVDQFHRVMHELYIIADSPYITEKEVHMILAKEDGAWVTSADESFDYNRTLTEMEYSILIRVLREENMNQSKAASRLGIGRSTLWRKLGRPPESSATSRSL